MRIRAATPRDLPALATLLAGSPLLRRYGLTAGGARRLLAEALRSDDLVLVATTGQAASGLAWVIPTRAFDRTAYLRLLLVGGPAQSRGIGTALLAAAERRASRGGARHLALLVTRTNDGARRFYERNGYRHVGDLPGLVRPRLDESMYVKTHLAVRTGLTSRVGTTG